jgi:myo-inositol 2-dehydrogenase/D-chiro-inositol 1-dehydrogenase
MKQDTVRLGFVGCGSHATNNLYPMLPYAACRLDAVCDRDPRLAERNARVFGAPRWFTDAARMLSECELDGVMVVGPPEMHYEVGKAVLQRGLPLFVEKPPAPDLERTRELVELARARRAFVMPGFMKRHGMPYAKARAMIERGEFVPAMGFFKYGHWACEELGGMLRFMSCHAIDLAISFFGMPVSITSSMYSSGRAISLAVTMRFADGRFAQLMLDSSQPRIQERVEISGSMNGKNALMVIDNVCHMEIHKEGRNGIDLLAPSPQEIVPAFDPQDICVWRPDYGIPNMGQSRHFFQGFAGEVREFVDAIRERREPYPGSEDCLKAMTVIERICATPNGTCDV